MKCWRVNPRTNEYEKDWKDWISPEAFLKFPESFNHRFTRLDLSALGELRACRHINNIIYIMLNRVEREECKTGTAQYWSSTNPDASLTWFIATMHSSIWVPQTGSDLAFEPWSSAWIPQAGPAFAPRVCFQPESSTKRSRGTTVLKMEPFLSMPCAHVRSMSVEQT